MSKRNVRIGIVIFCCLSYIQVFAQQNTEPDYVPGELLVRFSPKENHNQRTKTEMNALADLICSGSIERSFKFIPGLCLVKLPQEKTVGDALELFNNREEILYAEPNHRIRALTTIPNDTYFNDLWGLHNTGQTGGTIDADIDAPGAWNIRNNADPNIIVAVIDSGVDYDHPDLADNMWINEDEYYGVDDFDDDGNGFDDDIYDYDFLSLRLIRD